MKFKQWLKIREETTTSMIAPYARPIGVGGLVRRDMYGTIPKRRRRRRSNNRRYIE